MKSFNLIVTIIIAIVVIVVGYGVFQANGSEEEINNEVAEITPDEERSEVNASILSLPIVAEIEAYKTFGTQPVQPNAAALNRVNPFDNL